jgi:hypothetical protein
MGMIVVVVTPVVHRQSNPAHYPQCNQDFGHVEVSHYVLLLAGVYSSLDPLGSHSADLLSER